MGTLNLRSDKYDVMIDDSLGERRVVSITSALSEIEAVLGMVGVIRKIIGKKFPGLFGGEVDVEVLVGFKRGEDAWFMDNVTGVGSDLDDREGAVSPGEFNVNISRLDGEVDFGD